MIDKKLMMLPGIKKSVSNPDRIGSDASCRNCWTSLLFVDSNSWAVEWK